MGISFSAKRCMLTCLAAVFLFVLFVCCSPLVVAVSVLLFLISLHYIYIYILLQLFASWLGFC